MFRVVVSGCPKLTLGIPETLSITVTSSTPSRAIKSSVRLKYTSWTKLLPGNELKVTLPTNSPPNDGTISCCALGTSKKKLIIVMKREHPKHSFCIGIIFKLAPVCLCKMCSYATVDWQVAYQLIFSLQDHMTKLLDLQTMMSNLLFTGFNFQE